MRLQNVIRLVVGCSVLLNVGFNGHSLAVSRSHKVCAQVRAGNVHCFASILSSGTDSDVSNSPHGYGPAVARQALAYRMAGKLMLK